MSLYKIQTKAERKTTQQTPTRSKIERKTTEPPTKLTRVKRKTTDPLAPQARQMQLSQPRKGKSGFHLFSPLKVTANEIKTLRLRLHLRSFLTLNNETVGEVYRL